MDTAPTITRETACHVLWHYGQPGARQPGRFAALLMQTLDASDVVHFHMIAAVYPELAAAMGAAKRDPDGIAELQRIAAGEVAA